VSDWHIIENVEDWNQFIKHLGYTGNLFPVSFPSIAKAELFDKGYKVFLNNPVPDEADKIIGNPTLSDVYRALWEVVAEKIEQSKSESEELEKPQIMDQIEEPEGSKVFIEDLNLTMQRFQYFIKILKEDHEIPLLTVMFSSAKKRQVFVLRADPNEPLVLYKIKAQASIRSYKPDQGFMCIPVEEEKFDGHLYMLHKGEATLREWKHRKGFPLSEGWIGEIYP